MKIFNFMGKASPVPDKGRFHQFYRETVHPLATHLRYIGLRNQAELEDIMQEAYLEAYKSFHTIKDDTKALSWLLTIGRRMFFRSLRTKKDMQDIRYEPITDDLLVDERIGAMDEQMHINAICAKVLTEISMIQDPSRRKVIHMFFLEEATLPEITVATGVGTSTLTTWISRFRSKIRPKLTEESTLEVPAKLEPRRVMI